MSNRFAEHNRKAEAFRALHVAGTPLVLPNAWDCASARIVEAAGAKAVGTSSAALANVLGYPDGEALPRAELVAAARRIARVAATPLTVDIEAGYSSAAPEVADLVDEILDAGAVGINLEDGTEPPALLAEKIGAIRERATRSGRDVFVNARCDVFLRGLTPAGEGVDETCRRAALYRGAGADGLFVPGLSHTGALEAIARRSALPLNPMVRDSAFPIVRELAAAGVARVSLGGALFHAALSAAQRSAVEVLASGTYGALFAGDPLSYGAANALFAKPRG